MLTTKISHKNGILERTHIKPILEILEQKINASIQRPIASLKISSITLNVAGCIEPATFNVIELPLKYK